MLKINQVYTNQLNQDLYYYYYYYYYYYNVDPKCKMNLNCMTMYYSF